MSEKNESSQNFEQSMARLEQIVRAMERGDVPLEYKKANYGLVFPEWLNTPAGDEGTGRGSGGNGVSRK